MSGCEIFIFISILFVFEIESFNFERNGNKNLPIIGIETDYYHNYETIKYLQLHQIEVTSTKPLNNDSESPFDSWSVIWYIASFCGLIIFFLIVSCSEWCCKKNTNRNNIRNTNDDCLTNDTINLPIPPETPPPSYEQFAPPSYNSICVEKKFYPEKEQYDVYVVPVHTYGTIVNSTIDNNNCYSTQSIGMVT